VELAKPCGVLVGRAAEAGLLISVTADSVIRIVPPLILTTAEADEIVARLTPWSQPSWRNDGTFGPSETSAMKHYLQFNDLSADEYAYLFERAAFIKKEVQGLRKAPAAGGPHAGHDLREGQHPHPREL
jgi:hypothetical protein